MQVGQGQPGSLRLLHFAAAHGWLTDAPASIGDQPLLGAGRDRWVMSHTTFVSAVSASSVHLARGIPTLDLSRSAASRTKTAKVVQGE
jgi:hypothetical protein